MNDRTATTDIAFTEAVKATQSRLGTREAMGKLAARRGFQTEITEDLAGFIATRQSIYLGTATADGQPYIQHRGGTPGFLEVQGPNTLRFRDLPGNKQFLTLGNLSENPRVFLFLMDYETSTRVKIWGEAEIVEAPEGRFIAITVTAWDPNCPQHIPKLYTEATVARVTEKLTARIARLEAQLQNLGEIPEG